MPRYNIARLALRLLRVHVHITPEQARALATRPHLVLANHVSLLDGVIVALASPVPLVIGVDTDYSRRSRLARLGMQMLARLGFGRVVPIDASAPFGLRALARALECGESVMLFPEGRISPDGRPLPEHPGARWLIERTGAPVARITIRGAERSRLFAKSGDQWWPEINLTLTTV